MSQRNSFQAGLRRRTGKPSYLRYFVDKFPLFIAPPLPALPLWSPCPLSIRPRNHCKLSDASRSPTSLSSGSFRLFASFIYPRPTRSLRGKRALPFRREANRLESDMSSEVLRYFQVRQRFEKTPVRCAGHGDFEFLNEAKSRFHWGPI